LLLDAWLLQTARDVAGTIRKKDLSTIELLALSKTQRQYSPNERTYVRTEGEQRLIRVLAAQGRRLMSVLILCRLLRQLAITGDL